MTERHSKLTMLVKVYHKTASAVEKALTMRLGKVKECVLTVTSDNGKEFANHTAVSQALDADFYFARPYHSWERGLNEHTNGLVRQYIPKKTCFKGVSDEKVQEVESLLNNRPRKVLQFMTPLEVFCQRRAELLGIQVSQ